MCVSFCLPPLGVALRSVPTVSPEAGKHNNTNGTVQGLTLNFGKTKAVSQGKIGCKNYK